MTENGQACVLILTGSERELLSLALRREGSPLSVELAEHLTSRSLPLELVTKTVTASFHALRSYQHHNASGDLAEEIANVCERTLGEIEERIPEGSKLSLHNGVVTFT